MRYQGGKGLLAQHLAPVILAYANGRPIVEPFHGGLAMTVALQPRLASDLSRPVSTLIRSVRSGWTPPQIDEARYRALAARRDDMDDPDVAFAGHCASFGGKWFGGLARPHKRQRDPIGAAWSTLKRRIEQTETIDFRLLDYREVPIQPGDVVYCDPPYAGTSADWPVAPFDHAKFWQWCRGMAAQGVPVLVSEFSAPEDATLLWQRERGAFTRNAAGSTVTERLFVMWQD